MGVNYFLTNSYCLCAKFNKFLFLVFPKDGLFNSQVKKIYFKFQKEKLLQLNRKFFYAIKKCRAALFYVYLLLKMFKI